MTKEEAVIEMIKEADIVSTTEATPETIAYVSDILYNKDNSTGIENAPQTEKEAYIDKAAELIESGQVIISGEFEIENANGVEYTDEYYETPNPEDLDQTVGYREEKTDLRDINEMNESEILEVKGYEYLDGDVYIDKELMDEPLVDVDKDIEESSVITDDGRLLVNMTATDIILVDKDGEKFNLKTSAVEGTRDGALVLPVSTDKKDMGEGRVATEFKGNADGEAKIERVKEYAEKHNISEIRMIGNAVQKEAYAGEVVGMISAVGRVAPGEKAAFADKFEIANDNKAPSVDWKDMVTDTDKSDIKEAIKENATEIDGKMVINTTLHEMKFFEKGEADKENGTTVPSDSKLVVNAEKVEIPTDKPDIVKTETNPTSEGADVLAAIKEYAKEEGVEVEAIGSFIAAQGYPGDISSTTPIMVDGERGAVQGEYNIVDTEETDIDKGLEQPETDDLDIDREVG